jgi:hypothetical protein
MRTKLETLDGARLCRGCIEACTHDYGSEDSVTPDG